MGCHWQVPMHVMSLASGMAFFITRTHPFAGIRYKFVRLGVDMHISVQKMLDDEMHPGLSNVDYTLLLAAMERPNMDVMTDDKALSGAISNRRDSKANGQIRSATSSYCKRRWFTARSVKRKLGNYIPGNARPSWEDGLAYRVFD